MRISWSVTLLAAFLLFAALPLQGQDGARYYVATNGSDTWSGTLPSPKPDKSDGPFATLARARDEIRVKKANLLKKAGLSYITVMIREGTYYLPEPLRFGPEDSGTEACPITYAAYASERPVISAGRRITGWTKSDGKLYTVLLPDVKEGKWYFRQLRVGQKQQIRARTPNYDPRNPYIGGYFLTVDDKLGQFGVGMEGVQDAGTWMEYKIQVPAAGEYVCWTLYACMGDMSYRTALSVDGGSPVTLGDMGDTGSYAKLRWARGATLRLTPGGHVLRWTNVRGGA